MPESVLITGAGHRVGAVIAKHLAAKGCFVRLHYHSAEADALALRDEIREAGGRADVIRADLRDLSEIDRMIEAVRGDEVTALINSASLFLPGTLSEASPENWNDVMNVGLRAVWYLTDRLAASCPSLRRVINIGDVNVSGGYKKHAVYGLAKAALEYLTRQQAALYAPRIAVSLITPSLLLKGDDESDETWRRRCERLKTNETVGMNSLLAEIDGSVFGPACEPQKQLIQE